MQPSRGTTHEGRKDVPGADALQGVHRRGLQDEQGQVCQSSHAEPLELFPGWLGDEGCVVIDLLVIFGVLVLGAVICLAVLYAFVKTWEHK